MTGPQQVDDELAAQAAVFAVTDRSVDEQLDGSTVEHSMLAAKIQRLHIFFSLLIPDMNHEERQLLDEAMIRTYAKKGITHDNESLRDP